MRIALTFTLLTTCTALALEIIVSEVSEAKRTEMSAAVFSGTVTNIQHLPLKKTNAVPNVTPGTAASFVGGRVQDLGLWRAEVVVDSITKQDAPPGKVAVVYYNQKPIGVFERCPDYPKIETNMSATFWCQRATIGGHTNVLYISTPSWVEGK